MVNIKALIWREVSIWTLTILLLAGAGKTCNWTMNIKNNNIQIEAEQ